MFVDMNDVFSSEITLTASYSYTNKHGIECPSLGKFGENIEIIAIFEIFDNHQISITKNLFVTDQLILAHL